MFAFEVLSTCRKNKFKKKVSGRFKEMDEKNAVAYHFYVKEGR